MKKLFLILFGMVSLSWADSSTPLLPIEDPATQRDFQSLSQKIASLTNPLNITSGTITQLQVSTIAGVTSINGSWPNPNILINGGFEFWQRTSSVTALASGSYGADRWKLSSDEVANVTLSTETATLDSGVYSAKVIVTATAGNKNWVLIQSVENYQEYKGKTVSVSARVWASAGNAIRIRITDGVSNFFTSYHPGGSAWQTITGTFAMSSSSTGLDVYVGMVQDGDKVAGTYYFDSVMLVIGSQPISFIPINKEKELAMCQRYYSKSYQLTTPPGYSISSADDETIACAQIGATTIQCGKIRLPVAMRTAPSVTLYSNTGTSGQWTWYTTGGVSTDRSTTVNNVSYEGFDITHGTALEYWGTGAWTADAEL